MSFSDTRKPVPFVEKAAWFVLGFAVVAMLHAVGGWWLNSGTGVLRTVLVLLALGVFAALHQEGTVHSRCEQSGEPLRLAVGPDGPEPSDWLFHCAVPAAHWWDDIVLT